MSERERAPRFLTEHETPPAGLIAYSLQLTPATGFRFHFESNGGDRRVFYFERGALEADIGESPAVYAFRAGGFPGDKPTRGGFFTSPDSINMHAVAHILLEGGASGDSFVCLSYGSWAGLEVKLTLSRFDPDGGSELILQETIRDADEHSFKIP
jgi:hypothetical protein